MVHYADLTRTAAGTPAGDVLRRFWQPIATQASLTVEAPIRPVRVLSEGLVLYRDRSGTVGLIQERCPHNGYPLAEGFVDERSLACYRHGWHFNAVGDCWVDGYQGKMYPIQWANAKAYPVHAYAGLYWAYLGPSPTPAPPHIAELERGGGQRLLIVHPMLECSWVDLAIEGISRGESLLAPSHSQSERVCLRLPVDDRHTWQVEVDFAPGPGGNAEDIEVVQAPGTDGLPPSAEDRAEAAMLWERWERELERDPVDSAISSN